MIRCNNCGTNNIDGSEYCDECGMRLDIAPPAPHDQVEPPIFQPPSAIPNEPLASNTMEGPLPAPPSFTTSTTVPKPATPAREPRQPGARGEQNMTGARPGPLSSKRGEGDEWSKPQRNSHEPRGSQSQRQSSSAPPGPAHTVAFSSRGRTDGLEPDESAPVAGDAPRVTARLIIERGGRIGKEFPITGRETNIGRWDADSGIFPDVDLDEDDPEAKISRRHARILNHNGQYSIEDLGSTNGTFINRGRRLLPGKRHVLQNGDEIIIGKTFLKFHILR